MVMAKCMSFVNFAKTHGKVKVRPYSMGGNKWTALLCKDDEGNETFISPPKDTNQVVNQDGEILVDFDLPAEEIAEQIKTHKNDLVVIVSNYNWEESDEPENLIYTLAAKIEVEEILINIDGIDPIYEYNTPFSRQIGKLHSYTFSTFRDISAKFMRELDDEEINELYEELNHGVNILTTNKQLHAYMYCFGLMHEAKLNWAFSRIPSVLFKPEIEIIDYACGQGIATVVFVDFLKRNDYFVETNDCTTEINKITLVEPSEVALARAALLCHKACPNADIETIACKFDDLNSKQISITNVPRVHLLSNILDMTCYDLKHFANVVNKIKRNDDLFICVDPWYHDNSRDGRQRKLMRLLGGKEIYHETFNAYELQEDRSWTAYITLFKI